MNRRGRSLPRTSTSDPGYGIHFTWACARYEALHRILLARDATVHRQRNRTMVRRALGRPFTEPRDSKGNHHVWRQTSSLDDLRMNEQQELSVLTSHAL